jgi:UPF0755 protein
MTERPYDAEDDLTEYDDVPRAGSYVPEDDDRSFGWEDEVRRPAHASGRGQPRFARRGGGRGRGRGPRVALGVAVVLLLGVGAFGVWVQRQLNPPGTGAARTITIPKGASTSSIGDLLEHDGIIGSSFVWHWYLKVNGGGPFEAGQYRLVPKSSMGDVVHTLESGPLAPPVVRVTIPEGFTLTQILARLSSPSGLHLPLASLQQVLSSGQVRSTYQPTGVTSSEGILFPDTYEFDPKKATAESVLSAMASEMDATLAELDVTAAQTTYHLTPYEILIVASLIQEETKVPSEAPMVARVIYNRLKQGIPLGIDATSRYEAELAGRSRNQINFNSTSPYNTRRQKGLPPTPIASPGRDAIAAALHPADGPWIYYVLQDAQGHHLFTASASEFAAAKQRCHDRGLGCG